MNIRFLLIITCVASTQLIGNAIYVESMKEFKDHIKEGSVVVDFYADWCGPCKQLAPKLEQFAQENPHIKVLKVNADEHPQLTKEYGASGLPTIVILKDGKETGREIGFAGEMTITKIKDHIAKHGAAAMPPAATKPSMEEKAVPPTKVHMPGKPEITGTIKEIDGKKMIVSDEIVGRVEQPAPHPAITKAPKRRMKPAPKETVTETKQPRRRRARVHKTEPVYYEPAPVSSCSSCRMR